MRTQIVGRFRSRSDAEGHLRVLKRMIPTVACQIQNCSTWQQLRSLWLAIEKDYTKHKQQYTEDYHPFLYKIWTKHRDMLGNEPESHSSPHHSQPIPKNSPLFKGGWGGSN